MKNLIRVHTLSLTRFLKRNRIMPKRTKHYPCLCEITRKILFLARISGILPIKSVPGKDTRSCSFVTPFHLIIYSVAIQLLYFGYFCFVYTLRWLCSQDKSYKDTDWYLMAVGHLISDLDSMATLFLGVVRSKRICRLFERLSKLDSSMVRDKKLKTNITRVVWLVLVYFCIKMFSSLHGLVFLSTSRLFLINCSLLESAFGVLVRGFTVIFPTVQIAIVYTLVVLTEEKFEYLADSVALTIDDLHSDNGIRSGALICIKTPLVKEVQQVKAKDRSEKTLDRLADFHLEIFSIVNEINSCTGFQLLIGNCSNLYNMIYYLYRYITYPTFGCRTRSSKLYYILSLTYRLVKVMIYMILGQRLHTKSLLPLRTLQKSQIIKLPSDLQQQLQTLMLQWNGKEAYLSACGIVNFGLWLCAPIAGNVITYLLVALQFEDTSEYDTNKTLVAQSIL